MTTVVVIFKILFLVLIAHSCCWSVAPVSAATETSKPKITEILHQHQETTTSKQTDERGDSSSVHQKFILPPPPPTTSSSSFTAASVLNELEPNSRSSSIDEDETREQLLAISSTTTTTTEANKPAARIGQLAGGENDPAEERSTMSEARARSEQDEGVNYAELCYLSNGGSSLTLTVNEASPVGFVIGTIEVNGDPALEGGNVDLFDDANASASFNSNSDSLATPSAASRAPAGSNHSLAEQTSSSSSSQQARHLAQRLQRLLGKRSTIGFHDQSILATGAGGSQDQQVASQMRQSQALLVAASSSGTTTATNSQQNNNRHWTIGSISGGNKQRARDDAGKLGAPWSQPQPNGSFYSLLGAGQSVTPLQLPPAVRLEPGTRNLILVRQLDKESPEGEQSLLINIRCSPRKSGSGGGGGGNKEITTIPVRIIVTDANDHAPEFQGSQPFVVNISETTPIETIVLRDLEAIDRDSAGPFSTIHYRVLEDPTASPHSGWLQFVNPLVPNLMVAHQLDYETQSSFQLTIIASDEGEPEPLWSSAQVQVNIIDFDDQNPRFLDEKYTLLMDETQQNLVGQNLQVLPRNLHAEDGDKGINAPILYSFDQLTSSSAATSALVGSSSAASSSAELLGSDPIPPTAADNNQQQQQQQQQQQFNVNHYLHLNPSTGEIRLLRQWPSQLHSSVLASPMTLVVRATQADNKDRQRGQQGIEFEPSQLSVRVPESAPINEKIARVRARYIQTNSAHATDEPTNQAAGGDQAVDVVPEHRRLINSSVGRQQQQLLTASASAANNYNNNNNNNNDRRPINYQILDDQTDQFGINGLGEIFIKRQLDYEHKQEFRIRILATYLKYSDICRVHVEVLNVNDNKPKFTQPQYTFHVTEFRLRSNHIGQVQAHDGDLNDTVRYSLSGEQAHLFNIHPSTGQVSLRSSIKQLNITNCQLIVIATDSLGQQSQPPQQQFTHQARLNLHIAPQLVGRSINFDSSTAFGGGDSAKARSLTGVERDSTADEWLTPAKQTKLITAKERDLSAISNQRSSVATVMASLQHMVKSVNFFDMPMSSALLLSALLAFLICLLFILLVSMSVHIYRRQINKSLDRRRHHQQQHLAHIRHAHLASTNQLLAMAAGPPVPQPALARYLQQSPSTNSTNTTPASSSSGNNGQSPPSSLRQQVLQVSEPARKMTAKVSPAPSHRPASVLSAARLSQAGMGPAVSLEPLETLSAQLQQRRAQQQLLMQQAAHGSPQMSMISSPSLGRRSKHSYRSTEDGDDDDDDSSSVMHYGHYSVNASFGRPTKPQQQQQQQQQKNGTKLFSANERDELRDDGRQLVRGENNNETMSSSQLHSDRPQAASNCYTINADEDGSPGIKSYRKLPANLGSLARPQVGKFSCQPTHGSEPKGLLTQANTQQDSAIASDESSSSNSNSNSKRIDQQQQQQQPQHELRRDEPDIEVPSPPLCRTGNLIRWPLGSVPQRVKKLTWDDELSQKSNFEDDDDPAAGECYVAPDYEGRLASAAGHRYQQQQQQQQEQEARMLFSNPCSPAPQMSMHSANNSQLDSASIIGQNNCFDYTIVENSQFQMQDTVSSLVSTSLSAQHHYLQQQQNQHQLAARLPPLTKTTSYLYSSNGSFQDIKRIPTSINQNHQHSPSFVQPPSNNQQHNDLITTAVL